MLRAKSAARPSSRSLFSLLAWCYYQLSDFVAAADCYERLTLIAGERPRYWLSYAQCLLYAGFVDEAAKALQQMQSASGSSLQVDDEAKEEFLRLSASVRYHQNDSRECKVEGCLIFYSS